MRPIRLACVLVLLAVFPMSAQVPAPQPAAPSAHPDAETHKAAVREFFAALEAMDIPRFLAVWAEDGVQEMPFAPGAFPRRLESRAAIEKQYAPLPTAYTGMKFPLRSLRATEEPGVVIAEYDGSIGLKAPAGGRYDNRYVGVFEFNAAGALARFTEYFDPFTLLQGFPGARERSQVTLPPSDEEQIRAVALRSASAADARDWAALRALFAEEVAVDYQSVTGQAPATVRADDLVAGWAKGLGGYAETRHHFSGFEVRREGDKAVCTFSGQATHRKADGGRWSCGGDYTHRLARTAAGWKITAAKFDMQWEQGTR